jgi:hypothetical protein
MHRVFSIAFSSSPGPGKHFPASIIAYKVCSSSSMTNGQHTCGMSTISALSRASTLPENVVSE